MRLCRLCAASALAAFMMAGTLGCSRKPASSSVNPTATTSGIVTATANTTPSGSATPSATATATPGDTPVAGASFKVGNWAVVVERFHAQVSAPEGVNIRSSPEVTANNRTGSLAPGSAVDVEGRAQGQEAEPGKGTDWYYVGTTGSGPQFIYGPTGTLTPLTGSATPATSSATASPRATP